MSRFLHKKETSDNPFHQEIDFEDAIRLPDGGSTCEIYRTRWQRREVFVKRLKEKYRTNPLYLDALDKEFEIGVNLKHPSLPDYREFHRDYIVMDYIDGETLVDMIKRKDPWLSNEKNVIRLLKELVEVTDYLHRHQVTHCDIKPDNIMITANNRNVVLIDLDKCYTDAFNDTSGDPSRYGLAEKDAGRIAIDFHGLGKVAEKLKAGMPEFKFSRYRKFVKQCQDKGCTLENLLEILDYKPGKSTRKFYWMITLAPFCVALLFGLVLWLFQGKNGYDYNYGISDPEPQKIDSLSSVSTEPEEKAEITKDKSQDISKTARDGKTKNTLAVPIAQAQLHKEAQLMASQLDERVQPYFDELNAGIDSLVSFSNRPDITGGELLERLRKHSDKEDEYIHETFAILDETYPNLTERETWRVIAYSKAYTRYKRRAEPILRELGMKVKELGNYEYLLETP